jgi:hypothetical protein
MKVKLLFLLLAVTTLLYPISEAYAISQYVYVTVPTNVYVDDAFINAAFWVYGYKDWRDFAYVIVYMAVYGFYSKFGIDMKIASYNVWNPPTLEVDNLLEEMYYRFSNQTLETEPKQIFIFLTGGDLYRNIYCGGRLVYIDYGVMGYAYYSLWYRGCVAAEISTRVVRHEVSHLYGADNHDDPSNPVNCVMCPYSESMDWCQTCKDVIWRNKFRFGFIIHQYSGAVPLQVEAVS